MKKTASPEQVTQLLIEWSNGDKAALDKLIPLVYDELRRLARYYMRRERAGITLQTTALVNEAYLRLVDQKNVHWQNRAHFFGIAAQLMHRILVDQARKRYNAKRGGDVWNLPIDGGSPKQLTQFKTERIFHFDWSRNTKQLAYARVLLTANVVLISNFR